MNKQLLEDIYELVYTYTAFTVNDAYDEEGAETYGAIAKRVYDYIVAERAKADTDKWLRDYQSELKRGGQRLLNVAEVKAEALNHYRQNYKSFEEWKERL